MSINSKMLGKIKRAISINNDLALDIKRNIMIRLKSPRIYGEGGPNKVNVDASTGADVDRGGDTYDENSKYLGTLTEWVKKNPMGLWQNNDDAYKAREWMRNNYPDELDNMFFSLSEEDRNRVDRKMLTRNAREKMMENAARPSDKVAAITGAALGSIPLAGEALGLVAPYITESAAQAGQTVLKAMDPRSYAELIGKGAKTIFANSPGTAATIGGLATAGADSYLLGSVYDNTNDILLKRYNGDSERGVWPWIKDAGSLLLDAGIAGGMSRSALYPELSNIKNMMPDYKFSRSMSNESYPEIYEYTIGKNTDFSKSENDVVESYKNVGDYAVGRKKPYDNLVKAGYSPSLSNLEKSVELMKSRTPEMYGFPLDYSSVVEGHKYLYDPKSIVKSLKESALYPQITKTNPDGTMTVVSPPYIRIPEITDEMRSVKAYNAEYEAVRAHEYEHAMGYPSSDIFDRLLNVFGYDKIKEPKNVQELEKLFYDRFVKEEYDMFKSNDRLYKGTIENFKKDFLPAIMANFNNKYKPYLDKATVDSKYLKRYAFLNTLKQDIGKTAYLFGFKPESNHVGNGTEIASRFGQMLNYLGIDSPEAKKTIMGNDLRNAFSAYPLYDNNLSTLYEIIEDTQGGPWDKIANLINEGDFVKAILPALVAGGAAGVASYNDNGEKSEENKIY